MTALARRADIGLLLLRLVLGTTFLLHGIDKLGDLAGAQQGFEELGIPLAGFMTPFVALTEVIGGGMLIVGLMTPLAGFALAIDMLVAGLTAHADKGFFAQEGGYEYVLVLGVGALALALAGAGRFSLDAVALRGSRRPAWLRTMAQQ